MKVRPSVKRICEKCKAALWSFAKTRNINKDKVKKEVL